MDYKINFVPQYRQQNISFVDFCVFYWKYLIKKVFNCHIQMFQNETLKQIKTFIEHAKQIIRSKNITPWTHLILYVHRVK